MFQTSSRQWGRTAVAILGLCLVLLAGAGIGDGVTVTDPLRMAPALLLGVSVIYLGFA